MDFRTVRLGETFYDGPPPPHAPTRAPRPFGSTLSRDGWGAGWGVHGGSGRTFSGSAYTPGVSGPTGIR